MSDKRTTPIDRAGVGCTPLRWQHEGEIRVLCSGLRSSHRRPLTFVLATALVAGYKGNQRRIRELAQPSTISLRLSPAQQ